MVKRGTATSASAAHSASGRVAVRVRFSGRGREGNLTSRASLGIEQRERPPAERMAATARTNLNAEQYAKADQAHMTEGTYVKVGGKLHPGRQPRQLSELRAFDLIQG